MLTRLRPAALLLALGLMLSLGLAVLQEVSNRARIAAAVEERTSQAADRILQIFDRAALGLRGTRGFLIGAGLDGLRRVEFLDYIASRDLPGEFPGILGLGFARRVADSEVARYALARRGAPGQLHGLEPTRGPHAFIEMLEPLAPNAKAQGFDLASEALRRDALEQAARSGSAVLTAPIDLVQIGPGRSRGVLMVLPVDRALASDHFGLTEGPAGFVFAPILVDELVASAGAATGLISLEITDVTDPVRPVAFGLRPAPGVDLAAKPAQIEITSRGRVWRFEARPLPDLIAGLDLSPPLLPGFAGLVLSLALAWLVALRDQLRASREAHSSAQARLGSLFDHANDVIIGTDLAGRVILWNSAAVALFGHPAETALGQELTRLTVPPDREEEEGNLRRRALQGLQTGRFDTVRRHADGQLIDVELSAGPLFDHTGRVIGVAKILRPIGDRLARMQALQTANATLETMVAERTLTLHKTSSDLRGLLDALPAPIGAWNRDLAPAFANEALAAALGRRAEEVASLSLPDLFDPGLRARFAPHVAAVLTGEERVVEHDLPGAPGEEPRLFVTRLVPRRMGEEVTGLYLVAHDVTKLQRTRERLGHIIEATHAGTWEIDLEAESVEVSPRLAMMLGLDPEAVSVLPRRVWRTLLNPEDAALTEESFSAHYKGMAPSHHVEVRLRHAQGHWVWVEITGKVTSRRADGRPRLIAGLCLDISARKQAEAARARSEALLERTGALARTGGWELDFASNEISWSNETCRIHGLPPGHKPDLQEALAFYPEIARQELKGLVERARRQGQGWDVELPFVRADGGVLWVRTLAEVQWAEGRPARIVGAFLDLTPQHAVQNALRAQVDLTRAMTEASPVAMYFVHGETSVVSMANAHFCHLVGLPREAVLGRPLSELIDSAGALQRAHLEAQPGQPTRAALIRTWSTAGVETSDIWVMASHMQAVLDGNTGVLGWLYDVTELREAREGAQRAQELLLQALSVTRTGLAIFDAQERLEMTNDHFGDLLRRAAPRLVPGARFQEVLEAIADAYGTPPGVARSDWLLDRLLDLYHGGEHVWQTNDGRHIHAVERKLSDGRTVSLRSDITELMRTRQEAEAASQAKSAFISTTSHEIRTPLHAILGLAYLLEREHLPEVADELVQRITHAGKTLLGLVNNVLDLAKIEAQQVELDLQEFNLARVVEEEFGLHAAAELNPRVRLRLTLAPDLPPLVLGDPGRLRQVLNNLLGNAVKFTPQGSVTLKVGPGALPDRIRFEVRDTGIGIAPDLQRRLFRPFVQADASVTRRFGGTGLGLAISAELVALMGGEIACESMPGEGSAFGFDIPLPAGRASLAPEDPEKGLRVLLAGEDALERHGLECLCRGLGWSVTSLESGPALVEAAVQAVQAGRPFDAVVLDWRLSGGDALGALAALQGRLPELVWPAVVLLGPEFLAEVSQAPGAGRVGAFLPKPATAASLFNAVHAGLADLPARAMRALGSAIRQPSDLKWLEGVRILVVDDNALNLDLARKILELEGAVVATCDGGRKALEILARDGTEFDAVLLDVQMPEIDGIELARRLRRLPALADLPVLALSAGVLREERRQALEAGMNDFLPKPLEPGRLIIALRRQVERRRGAVLPVQSRAPLDLPLPLTLSLPGIDESAIARHLLSDRPLLVSMLRRFLDGAQDLATAPGPELVRQLHKLRGAASVIGAVQVALTIRSVEEAQAAQDERRALGQLDLLHRQLGDLRQRAAPVFAAEDRRLAARDAALPPAPPLSEVDRQTLLELFASGNAKSLSSLEAHAAAICARYGAERLAELRNSLAGFDFPRAAALLQL